MGENLLWTDISFVDVVWPNIVWKKIRIYLFDKWVFIAKMRETIVSCEVGQIYGASIIEYVTKSFFFPWKDSWEKAGAGMLQM